MYNISSSIVQVHLYELQADERCEEYYVIMTNDFVG